MSLFTLKELFYVCVGLMLMAFAVISVTVERISLQMIPVTLGLLVVGGYLARRGVKAYFQRVGGTSQTKVRLSQTDLQAHTTPSTEEPQPAPKNVCPQCGKPVDADELFCGNCGASLK